MPIYQIGSTYIYLTHHMDKMKIYLTRLVIRVHLTVPARVLHEEKKTMATKENIETEYENQKVDMEPM